MKSKKEGKESLKKEIFRKSIHVSSALVPFCLDKNAFLTIFVLSFFAVLYLISELVRSKGGRVPVINYITKAASRKRDEGKISKGPLTLVAGILLTVWIFKDSFSRDAGLYALSFGDGLASLAGKFIGGKSLPFFKEKTVAGSLACFIAVFVSSYILSGSAVLSSLLAFVAVLIEALPLKDMDNVFIPLIVSFSASFLPQILKMKLI